MSIGKKSKAQVQKVRQIVYDRDDHECVVRGSLWATLEPCGSALSLQHRVGRGQGGSALYDAPAFLTTMCFLHNALAESSAEFAKFCARNGFSLRRSLADQHPISRVPIRYPDGWQLLSGDGRFAISENTARELMEEIYGEESDE
jgi:hypothetical protein